MADPLLGHKYPLKGLYQALAVASMCLQEEASTRPLISDVVTALEFLSQPNDDLGSPRDSFIKGPVEDSEEDEDEEEHKGKKEHQQRNVDKLKTPTEHMM